MNKFVEGFLQRGNKGKRQFLKSHTTMKSIRQDMGFGDPHLKSGDRKMGS